MVVVRDRVLLLPLIGTVDAARAEALMQTILERVVSDSARAIIVDVAGVPDMDTFVAGSLVRVAESVRLLGAITVLTGLGPSAARTLVHLGVDLSAFHTRGRLTEGIDLALQLTAPRR